MGILLKIPDIVFYRGNLVDIHPPLNAPADGIWLIQGKVMSCLIAKKDKDLLQRFRNFPLNGNNFYPFSNEEVFRIVDQLLRHLFRRQNIVYHTGCLGASRHAVIRGCTWILNHYHTTLASYLF